jgi:hypothetical protein
MAVNGPHDDAAIDSTLLFASGRCLTPQPQVISMLLAHAAANDVCPCLREQLDNRHARKLQNLENYREQHLELRRGKRSRAWVVPRFELHL